MPDYGHDDLGILGEPWPYVSARYDNSRRVRRACALWMAGAVGGLVLLAVIVPLATRLVGGMVS